MYTASPFLVASLESSAHALLFPPLSRLSADFELSLYIRHPCMCGCDRRFSGYGYVMVDCCRHSSLGSQEHARVLIQRGSANCLSFPMLSYSLEVLVLLTCSLQVVHRVEAVVRHLLQPTLY